MDTDDLPVVLPSSTTSALTISLYVPTTIIVVEFMKFSLQASSANNEYLRTSHSTKAAKEYQLPIW